MVERNVMDLWVGVPRSKWTPISPVRDGPLERDYESIPLPWFSQGSRTSYSRNADSPKHLALPMDLTWPGERRYADSKPHVLPFL